MNRKRIVVVLAFCLVVVAIAGQMTSGVKAAPPELKGVLCHATGSAGNPFVGLLIGLGTNPDGTPDGTFSNNGHLDANGNPESGHEDDVFIGANPPAEKSDCDKLPPPDPK